MWRWTNQTRGIDFVLLGLFHHVQVSNLFFSLIFSLFIVTLVGNIMMIIHIWLDSLFHATMYFLFNQLSIMDILYSSTIDPKIAADYLSMKNNISFVNCGIQLFLSMTLVGSECLLLAVMAYDHYVSICHLLHYSVLRCPKVCALMVVGTWLDSLFSALVHVIYTLILPYCSSLKIHHFFCEIPALLKLVSADTSLYGNGLYVNSVAFLLIPISVIVVSYGQILSTLLRLGSNLGMRKALASCSSHMIVVSPFYETANIKYFLLKAYHTAEQDEIVSIIYTIVTPMLNPLIYSLQNKEVAKAFRKLLISIKNKTEEDALLIQNFIAITEINSIQQTNYYFSGDNTWTNSFIYSW